MALATLDDVKKYLNIQNANEDLRIEQLLTALNPQILAYLGYDPALQPYTERRDGNGKFYMVLAQPHPVEITSLTIDGIPVPVQTSAPIGDGYILNGSMVQLFGSWKFNRGMGNIIIQYQAGYSSVPGNLTQGLVELVSLRLREIQRLGTSSKSLAGESVTYVYSAIPETVRGYLDSYKKVIHL